MTTTTKLALYDVADAGKRVGTLELSDLSSIKGISYGKAGKPEDNSHVVTIQLEGSLAPLFVRAVDTTNAQFIQDWCDAAGGSDPGSQVSVSSNDATSGFLDGKLVAGTNITLTELNGGQNETLEISASGGTLQDAYGLGNSITVVTADGSFTVQNSADDTDTIAVSRTFAGGGDGIAINMAAGTTDRGLSVVAAGSGLALEISQTGAADVANFRTGAGAANLRLSMASTGLITLNNDEAAAATNSAKQLVLASAGANIADIEILTVDADPNGVVSSVLGSLALSDTGAAYLNTGGTDVWTALGAGGGVSDLQGAYDGGKTVDTNTDDTAVSIAHTDGSGTHNLLELDKSPSASLPGNALNITMGGNALGEAISITDGTETTRYNLDSLRTSDNYTFSTDDNTAGDGSAGFGFNYLLGNGANGAGATAGGGGGGIATTLGIGGTSGSGTGGDGGGLSLIAGLGGISTTGQSGDGGFCQLTGGVGAAAGGSTGGNFAGVGGGVTMRAGAGGLGLTSVAGRVGGESITEGGLGGGGTASAISGGGGNVTVNAGAAGATGGFGIGTDGVIDIGVTTASAINLGNATSDPVITALGSLVLTSTSQKNALLTLTQPTQTRATAGDFAEAAEFVSTGTDAATFSVLFGVDDPNDATAVNEGDVGSLFVDTVTPALYQKTAASTWSAFGAGGGGGGQPQLSGNIARQEIDDLLLATETKLGSFTLDPALFSGATFSLSMTGTLTDAGGAAASFTLRLYDMGAPNTPIAPVLRSDLVLSTAGSLRREEVTLTLDPAPGVNIDEIFNVERIYEIRGELTGDVGDLVEIDWAGILGT